MFEYNFIYEYWWLVDHIQLGGHSWPTSDLCKTYKNYIVRDLSVCSLIAVSKGTKYYFFCSL